MITRLKMPLLLATFICLASTSVYAASNCVLKNNEREETKSGNIISKEGAWCWFADPRAMHYENEEQGIDATYIGYIDVHGAIKATQCNNKTGEVNEVLVRSYFQPDDHNNPTFLALPDGRIMIFYSRHTDEPCFYYRISRVPGDITTLGDEKRLDTGHNTTYPSPFILSNDPKHIYLCWRGIEWHPTMARLTLPDKDDNVKFDWGPKQIVRYSHTNNGKAIGGSRPYAKYTSNGKDKILVTYTTTHPDNENPNWVYFNYVNIPTNGDVDRITLTDVKGKRLSKIDKGVHIVNKSAEYLSAHRAAVVDSPDSFRDWVWQVAMDKQSRPIIGMVRISADKSSHNYYYVRWTGKEWEKIFLENGGGHFHQTPTTERCYSGGMAIDTSSPDIVYASVPVKGRFGKVYEIKKYKIAEDGSFTSEQLTHNSEKNNIRPYVISNSGKSDLRLLWMHGDYYYWIVNSRYPQGYPTAIHSATPLPQRATELKKKTKGSFTIIACLHADGMQHASKCIDMGSFSYNVPTEKDSKPYVSIGNTLYESTNVLGNSDLWKKNSSGTDGRWPGSAKLHKFWLAITYHEGIMKTYINGVQDQYIQCGELTLRNMALEGLGKSNTQIHIYDSALFQDEIKDLLSKEIVPLPDIKKGVY